ncbi:MAG: hypothetical protein ACU0DI_01360, partial [Paracoccaceae bacterium]
LGSQNDMATIRLFQDFDFLNLLNKTGKGDAVTRFYAQVGMIFSHLGSEGGLFLVIGRKS